MLLALVLRIACARALALDVRSAFAFDASFYDSLARRLADGGAYADHLGNPTAFFPPGYPAVLAVAYFAFGQSQFVAWTLNAVSGALTCLFVFLIGARLFSPALGLAAAGLLAVFPGDVFRSAAIMSEAVFGCLLSAAIYLFARWDGPEDGVGATRPGRWLCFGLLLGGATLVRAAGLIFLAGPAVVWLVRDGVREAVARTAITLAGLLLVVLPWTVRNASLLGAPVLSTDGTFAFFNAHNPLADGSQSFDMNEIRAREWPWIAHLPPTEREIALSREELRYGVRYLLGHPRRELASIAPRLGYLYGSDHHPLSDHGSSRVHRAAIWGADLFFFAVLILALLGVPETVRPLGSRLVLPATVLCVTTVHGVLFFGDPRYHAPLAPVLALLAVVGAQRVLGWMAAR